MSKKSQGSWKSNVCSKHAGADAVYVARVHVV